MTENRSTTSSVSELAAYSMILLRCDDRYLMLQRGAHKTFAPGRWTGIGGRIDPGEMSDLQRSALREVTEETGITPAEISHFVLRRALLNLRPDQPLTVLLYFTGEIDQPVSPACEEGTLYWLSADELQSVDVIENTRQVIPLLIGDMQRDRAGSDPLIVGASAYAPDGTLGSLLWAV